MASYYGEFDSSVNIVGEGEESLLESYQSLTSVFSFTGTKAFRRCCLDREKDFADGSNCNEYILFKGVSQEDMMTVDRIRKSLRKMCCFYDVGEEVLIVKLMLGVGHEAASLGFNVAFTKLLLAAGVLDQICFLGSSGFGDGRREKESDQAFKPRATRPTIHSWPSLTCEIGFSESLPELRNDAYFWLTKSQLQTNIVLVIHIDRVRRQIEIERWEVIIPQRPRRTTSQYPPSVGCVQRLVLREGHIYIGPPLELAVEKVFDIVPPNLAAGALDFSAADLQSWNDLYWVDYP